MNEIYDIWIPAVAAALIMASFFMAGSLLTILAHNILGHEKHHVKLTRFSFLYFCGALLAMLLLTFFAITVVNIPFFANDHRFIWSLYALLIIDGLFVLMFYYRSDRGTRLWLPRKSAVNLTRSVEQVNGGGSAFFLGGLGVFSGLLRTVRPNFYRFRKFVKTWRRHAILRRVRICVFGAFASDSTDIRECCW